MNKSFEDFACLFQSKGVFPNRLWEFKKFLEINGLLEVSLKQLNDSDNRPKLDKDDKFISSHDGYTFGESIINPYDIFEDSNGMKYIRMFIKEDKYVFFDYEDHIKLLHKKDGRRVLGL